jgi:hypothetical protein
VYGLAFAGHAFNLVFKGLQLQLQSVLDLCSFDDEGMVSSIAFIGHDLRIPV